MWWCFEKGNRLYFGLAGSYSTANTPLYFNSLNNLRAHLDSDSTPLTALAVRGDAIWLGLVSLGSGATFMSNWASQFIRIKNFFNNTHHRYEDMHPSAEKLLLLVTVLNILNKTTATSTSFYALLRDNNVSTSVSWFGFGGAVFGNLLAQCRVLLAPKDWRFNLDQYRLSCLAAPVTGIAVIFYTLSFLALYWNGINNDLKTLGLQEERMTVSSLFHPQSFMQEVKLIPLSLLFLCSLTNGLRIFYPGIRKTLLSHDYPEHKQSSRRSSCRKITSKCLEVGDVVLRTGVMLLGLAAFMSSFGIDGLAALFAEILLPLLACPGTVCANMSSVFFRHEPRHERLLDEELLSHDDGQMHLQQS